MSTISGHARAYTPGRTVAYESLIGMCAAGAMAGRPPLAGPVSLIVVATFPIPASWSKRKRAAALWHTGKPDLDNMLKAIADGGNGILWGDDRCIARVALGKQYGEPAGLDIIVEPLA